MADVSIRPFARKQLADIWLELADVNRPAADRLIERFYRAFELKALFPLSGETQPSRFTGKLCFDALRKMLFSP